MFFERSFPFFNYLLLFLSAYLAYSAFRKIRFRWQGINGLLVNLFFLILGYQLFYYQNDWNNKNHFRQYLQDENIVIGIVDNAPAHNNRTIQVNLKVREIDLNDDSRIDCSGKIMLRFRNDSLSQKINYGDLLLVNITVKPIQSSLNPEAFNFKRYLHFKNIHYQSFVSDGKWNRLESGHGSPVLNWSYKIRLNLLQTLKKSLKFENEYAVASALILGYKDELSEELKSAYANTGAMHVLAVSGLHTGLIWGIIAFLLKWIRWKHPAWQWIKTGITIACLWLFALITGASPSVLRAATMFTFLLIGQSLNRNTNIYNTLAGSAFCLLLFNPFLIVEVGFQLSYLAVIGIVYFYKKIYNLWYIENRIGDYLWRLTSVAFAAQLSTFPLSLFYFHQFPAYFWLSGLVVVPFAFLILGTGLSLFFIDQIIPFLSPLFAKLLIGCIWLMNAIIFLIEQLPSDFFKNIWIEGSTMILLYLVILFVVKAINSRKFKWLILGMSLLALMSFYTAFKSYYKEDNPSIVFYHFMRKSYIECIENTHAISYGDLEISEKSLKYATQNFHTKQGILKVDRFHFGHKNEMKDNWYLQNDFIQFFDKKIAFIDALPSRSPTNKIEVNFIVFRKKSNVSIKELNQFFEYDKIIFDGALSEWRLLKLKKECRQENVSFYDVNRRGALIIEID